MWPCTASDDIPADGGKRAGADRAASVTYPLAHNTRGIAAGSGGRGDGVRVISTSNHRTFLLPTNAVHGRVLRCKYVAIIRDYLLSRLLASEPCRVARLRRSDGFIERKGSVDVARFDLAASSAVLL